MPKRVVIVGAGPGGLATAILLGHAGLEVDVVERLPVVGGRTSAIEAEGFRFDRGPTFFLYPKILQEIFATVGLDLFKEIPMRRLDPQYRLVFGMGGELRATPDMARMQAEIARLSPHDARRLPDYFNDNRQKMNNFAPILESPFSQWRDLLNPRLLAMLPLLRPWNSLEKDLRNYFDDPRIRLAFTFQAKYLGMSPFQCPSLFSILCFLEYEYGVFHPMGGCAAVSEKMAQIAQQFGVRFHLGEDVQHIDFDGRRATRVHTDRGSYALDALVINADFAQAMTRLMPDNLRRRWSNKSLERKQYSCSTYMLYLGLRGVSPIDHHTIYFSSDYERNLEDITEHHRLSPDPSFYVRNACVTDPALAPPGHSTLYVLFPVPHESRNINWSVETPRFREIALDQLQKIGLGDIRERIVYEQIVSPADWREKMQLYRGSTFSLSHTLTQMLHLRPQNRFSELEGVYLVGGGTHPGSGLPVIFSSARISSRLLCEDLDVAVEWDDDLTERPSAMAGAV